MKFKLGHVYSINCIEYIYVGGKFKEDWDTGGTGTYYHDFIMKVYMTEDVFTGTSDDLYIKTIEVKNYVSVEGIFEGIFEVDEPPYEINRQEVTKYTLRKKKPKTITVYE